MCVICDDMGSRCGWQQAASLGDYFVGWEKPGIPLCEISDDEPELHGLLKRSYKVALETAKEAAPLSAPQGNGPPLAGKQPPHAHFAPIPCAEMLCT
jgi:hypothetical protein